MATAAPQPYYTFIKGLVTESSPLIAPENQCEAMMNVRLGVDGSLSSRNGVEAKTSDIALSETVSGTVFCYAETSQLEGGTPGVRYLGVYFGGEYLHIFDVSDPDAITLATSVSAVYTAPTFASLTAIKGYFILCTDTQRPRRISYTNASDITIKIRDLDGVDDNLEVNDRPGTLSNEHLYNLYNQGWPSVWIKDLAFPSNADVPWLGVYTDPLSGTEVFSADQIRNTNFGVSPAPKGRVIFDAFNTAYINEYTENVKILATTYDNGAGKFTHYMRNDQSRRFIVGDDITFENTAYTYVDGSAVTQDYDLNTGSYTITDVDFIGYLITPPVGTSLPNGYYTRVKISDTISGYASGFTVTSEGKAQGSYSVTTHPDPEEETSHPVAVAAYGSRVWYGGVLPAVRESLKGVTFFSQVITDKSRLGLCYSENDPTARDNNEPLATDGGYIPSPEMGRVLRIAALKDSNFLFADNGVWRVSGKDGIFDPTAYAVERVSDRGLQSPNAVAVLENSLVYYSKGKLYSIQPTEIGTFTASSISDGIDSYFADIVGRDDTRVTMTYDRYHRRIHILFPKDMVTSVVIDELVLDTKLGAYYPNQYTCDATDYIVAGWSPEVTYTDDTTTLLIALKNSGTEVAFLAATEEDVVVDSWNSEGFTSYFRPCNTPLDSAQIKKTMPRIAIHMKNKESVTSYVKVQGRFSWSITADAGKWGSYQTVWAEDSPGFALTTRSLTVRGVGRAVQLHFTNNGEAPFTVHGWDIKYAGKQE